jgi:hypothetical protein
VSRNSSSYGEPLYGIAAIPSAEIDGRISTPGNAQQAIINPNGVLKYTADLTPDGLDPASINSANPNVLFRPLFANDIIYGGLGNDWMHGGAGDDAVSGAEAPVESYAFNYDQNGAQVGALLRSDYSHPFNPGNVLGYSPAKTYQAQYNPNNPLGRITVGGKNWLLNSEVADGVTETFWTNGTPYLTDGNDHVFGDLGNDWLVGGTGRDALWGGWGNDMLGADDNLNTTTPDPNASYEDLAFGGAGLDVLLGNTGGDRLIDWQGEFNTFIVPFNPFGLGTVSRLIAPSLPEFLYALSKSEGADQTLAAQHSSSAARNGEPFGELGLIRQEDAAWGDQNAGPRDPQGPTYKNSKDIKSTDGTRLFDAAPAWVAPAPLTAASAPESPVAAGTLTSEQLAPIVAAARRLWLATGLTTEQMQRLEQARVWIADLDGLYLGVTEGGSVTIDVDAAGWGWSAGGIDLLTVVAHELGHAIGLDHADHGVMEATIGIGERELPEATSVGSSGSPSSEAQSAPALVAAAQEVAWSTPGTIIILRPQKPMRPGFFTRLAIRVWPHRSPWRARTRHGRG